MLRLLGTPFAEGSNGAAVERPPARLFALLAVLALSPGKAASRSSIAATLWETSETARAQASLRQLLAATRRWEKRHGVTVLDVTADRVARGDRCLRSDLDGFMAIGNVETPDALSSLIDLYRGDLLDGFAEIGPQFDEWLAGQRDRLRERFFSIAITAAERIGGSAGEGALRRVLQQFPFEERLVRGLMRVLSRGTDVAAAFAVYDSFQLRLRDQLGTRPASETVGLAQQLAAQSNSGSTSSAEAAAPSVALFRDIRHSAEATFRAAVPRLMILLPETAHTRVTAQTRLLARTLVEDVTTNLGRLRTLAVIAPHTAARVELVDARTAALQHRIDYVVETHLRHSGAGTHRLELKLLHVDTAELLWTETFGFADLRQPENLRKLAQWLAAVVTNTVERSEMRSLGDDGPLAAYRHFLMGRHALRTINLEGIRRARKWFQQAAHLNPNFAPAQSWLAHCAILEWMVFSHSGPDLLHRAADAAQLAIDIDPTDGNGHRELGRAALFLGRLDDSLELFDVAERFAPHHADLLADYADTLMHNSQPHAAKQRIDQALSLNPLAPDVYFWIAGGITFFCGEPDAALGLLKKMRKPDQAYKLMAASAALAGYEVEAALYRKRALSNDPDFDLRTWALRLPQRERAHLDMYVEALRAAGFV